MDYKTIEAANNLVDELKQLFNHTPYLGDNRELAGLCYQIVQAATEAVVAGGYDRIDIWADVLRQHADETEDSARALDIDPDETYLIEASPE
jgi:hypothetical protein